MQGRWAIEPSGYDDRGVPIYARDDLDRWAEELLERVRANGSTADWIRVEKALVFFEQDADPGITRAVASILVNLADRKTARAPHIDLSAAAAAIRVEDD